MILHLHKLWAAPIRLWIGAVPLSWLQLTQKTTRGMLLSIKKLSFFRFSPQLGKEVPAYAL